MKLTIYRGNKKWILSESNGWSLVNLNQIVNEFKAFGVEEI